MSNQITVKLRLVKDFEIRQNTREDGSTSLVAVSRGVDNKRRLVEGADGKWEDVRDPNWFYLVIFSHKKYLIDLAAAELRKGASVIITGELQHERFTKDGKDYQCNKIIVSDYALQAGSLLKALECDSLPASPEKDPSLEPDAFSAAVNNLQ